MTGHYSASEQKEHKSIAQNRQQVKTLSTQVSNIKPGDNRTEPFLNANATTASFSTCTSIKINLSHGSKKWVKLNGGFDLEIKLIN